ncbi:Pyrrolidone-carboxylate peptidase [compost metagenome]|uniref:Pyrrolidone-carboxylate peptidase n=1 Tax=Paenibacillus rhizolycopersici TaxID=2780073 RepID=A0ABS2H3T4_9BACL|nr:MULTISPECIES: pyroglutamyl-peptidase I [Paenibacillus]MBM6996145.1 pyroglutamyl-peptidase I [Paenibacillus rhizolycopersici]MUG84998.1 pyroglutamyl-peptidase I [Paenibacillus timonensis]GIP47723.1 pyrrolidone-carboxylate peptidase [Paenibacillus sp. J53TS2]
MRKLLLTGFEPFGGESINPAVEAVHRLQGRVIGSYEVIGLELPTVFGQSMERLLAGIEETEPEVVIALGQAGGRRGISFERIAVNLSDAAIDDNAGNRPVDVPVVPEGPAAYWTTLPVRRMADRLQVEGIPASLSLSAGTFVCNHLFYGLMHHLAVSGKPIRGGFIHIPYLPEQAERHPGAPSMALEQLVAGLELAIRVMGE